MFNRIILSDGFNMSKAIFMIDCQSCMIHSHNASNRSSGIVSRTLVTRHDKFIFIDICERCGGSKRMPVPYQDSKGAYYKTTQTMSKRHKFQMKEWIEKQKELLYGGDRL